MIDNYLNMNLIFDVSTNDGHCGTVVKQSWLLGGREISFYDNNPSFDTREYEMDFTDGMRYKYTANIIAENMYAQVDE